MTGIPAFAVARQQHELGPAAAPKLHPDATIATLATRIAAVWAGKRIVSRVAGREQ
eukprot:COSAG05_NODE_5598_length_1133_cov_1.771760_1_plen_56_part_00